MAIFLIVVGGILSILDFLTENSQSIFLSGLIIFLLLILFKNRFRS